MDFEKASNSKMDGSYTERKLTNQDFRNIVLTARSSQPIIPTQANLQTETKKKFKKPYLHKLKDRLEKNPIESEDTSSKYRDRAKERREGVLGEEIDLQQLTLLSTQSMSAMSKVAIGDDNIIIDAEKSKYLGGDIEHTHLVKGLDYALLENAKRDNLKPSNRSFESCLRDSTTIIDLNENSKPDKFNSVIARNIHSIISRAKSESINNFNANRVAYVFTLDEDFHEASLPVTLIRSSNVDNTLDKYELKPASHVIIQRLSHVLSYLRSNEKASINVVPQSNQQSSQTIEDFNIYDEIESYDPQKAIERYKNEKIHNLQPGPYFTKPENIKEEIKMDKKMLVEDIVTSLSQQDKPKVLMKQVDKLDKKLHSLLTTDDGYAECYPDFGENLKSVIESDEENVNEDNKKPLVNRWDFASEEEYNKYVEAKKVVIKSGRRHRPKENENKPTKKQILAKEKAKLNRELEQINTIISHRKSSATSKNLHSDFTPSSKRRRI